MNADMTTSALGAQAMDATSKLMHLWRAEGKCQGEAWQNLLTVLCFHGSLIDLLSRDWPEMRKVLEREQSKPMFGLPWLRRRKTWPDRALPTRLATILALMVQDLSWTDGGEEELQQFIEKHKLVMSTGSLIEAWRCVQAAGELCKTNSKEWAKAARPLLVGRYGRAFDGHKAFSGYRKKQSGAWRDYRPCDARRAIWEEIRQSFRTIAP